MKWVPLLLVVFSVMMVGCSSPQQPTGAAIAGTAIIQVVDEQALPLDGVEVYVNYEYQGKTSKYGDFPGSRRVLLTGTENTIRLGKEGYQPLVPITLDAAGEEQRIFLTLERKKTSFTIIVENNGGDALPEASIFLQNKNSNSQTKNGRDHSLLPPQTTDEEGKAYFPQVPDGSYALKIRKEGYDTRNEEIDIDYFSEGKKTFTVALHQIPFFEVQVVDEEQNALFDAEVMLYTKEAFHDPGSFPEEIKYTNYQGNVRFEEVIWDENYVISVKKERYLAQLQDYLLTEEQPGVEVILLQEES